MKKEIIDTSSLAHTKWNCKYHIVFAPKYRRKVFFEEKRMEIREILRQLCQWKGVGILDKTANIKKFQDGIKRVVISQEEIAEAIKKAGKQIDEWYNGEPILLVSVLKGAFVFLSDLARAVSVPCEIDFMCAKSYYQGTTSSGMVNIKMDLDHDITNYHVIIV